MVHDHTPATPDDVGYTASVFVQAVFPYRKPKDGADAYRREVTQGATTIIVTSDNGLPYGKYPRLIMAYIITAAVERIGNAQRGLLSKEEARVIPLGRSLSAFLKSAGIKTGGHGGTRGPNTLVKDQIERLMTTSISVQTRWGDTTKGAKRNIAKDWTFWRDGDDGQGVIELTPEFADMLYETPIPVDMRTLCSLNKPRAIDLYLWLTLKQYWLNKRGIDVHTFSWDEVEHQFAVRDLTTAVQHRDFRNEIKSCLEQVQKLWPACGATTDTKAGVTVARTTPSIPMKRALRGRE